MSRALSWAGTLLLIGLGLMGASSTTASATGLVVLAGGGALLVRHGPGGFSLLHGALTGRMMVTSWPEASEAVQSLRRGCLLGGWVAGGLALLLTGSLQGLAPILVAHALSRVLLAPLSARLRAGYQAWEAAACQVLRPQAPLAIDRARTDAPTLHHQRAPAPHRRATG